MTLVKKLSRQGNSNALVLDKSIMDLVGIKPDSWVSIETPDGKSLTITPIAKKDIIDQADGEHMAKVREAIDKTHKRFDGALRKLAE